MPGLTQQYSAVVLGCGRIGSLFSVGSAYTNSHAKSHAEAYFRNANTRLIGLADSNPDALKTSADYWKVEEISQNAIELCRTVMPDLVSICSPDHTHAKLLNELLSLPKPPLAILVEKPLSLDLNEAIQIQNRLNQNPTKVAVNYSRRYSPFFQKIAAALRTNQFGKVLGAQAIYGKGLFHNGSHLINLLRFWFGEPRSVSASQSQWGPNEDPTISFNFMSASGFEVQALGIDERLVTSFELTVLTEKYKIEFSLGGQTWEFYEVRPNPFLPEYKNYFKTEKFPIPIPVNPLDEALDQAVSNLVQLASNPAASNWCPVSDAVKDLSLLNQIRELSSKL